MEMNHERFMELALQEAEIAVKQGEVPIGAVIVKDGRVIAKAHNMREQWLDATAHAEVIAIREACEKLHNWRLSGCTLYVTVEPCPMCAGAIYNSRVDTVIFGCRDNRAGAVESLFNVLTHPLLNHQPQVIGGILEDRYRRHSGGSVRGSGQGFFCRLQGKRKIKEKNASLMVRDAFVF